MNETKPVKKNSLRAWMLAARPKTLAAGVAPVLVASGLAAHDGRFNVIPAILCLVFAMMAQIASNFANDYFDYIKKTDNEERLGPARAVSSGWIDPMQMLIGLAVVIAVACFFGMGLILTGFIAEILWSIKVPTITNCGPYRPTRDSALCPVGY